MSKNKDTDNTGKDRKIYCSLPHGLAFTLIDNNQNKRTVTINGVNSSNIIGATYGITEINSDDYNEIKKLYGTHLAFVNSFITESVNDLSFTTGLNRASQRQPEVQGLRKGDIDKIENINKR